jgi:hypothetical protein
MRRVCSLPLLGEQVAPQAAERTALVAMEQAANGFIESYLADLDERVPRTSTRQEHEARIWASHGRPSRRSSK